MKLKVTFSLEEKIFKDLKKYSAENMCTMSGVIEKLLEEFLRKQKKEEGEKHN